MTYYSAAKQRWSKAEWIRGEGRYAVLARCGVLTVTLWPTIGEAEVAKREIDETACGSRCNGLHEIVDLDAPTTCSSASGERKKTTDSTTTPAANQNASIESCSTCRYFFCHRSQGESARVEADGTITRAPWVSEHLLCRRFPAPVAHDPWDWCGEYSPLTVEASRQA
jgi:hypothetical protein